MKSFRDPDTHVLKAFGYCDENAPNDLSREEPDDFALDVGRWQLVGEEWMPYAAPAVVPQAVAMWQARQALLGAGLLDAVNAALASMPGAAGEAARIEWEYSNTVQRNRPLVQSMAAALGLTDAGLDALFIAAAVL